jgi:hypothetical protein
MVNRNFCYANYRLHSLDSAILQITGLPLRPQEAQLIALRKSS